MKKLCVIIMAALLSVSAWAWPTKPITLIVPYPPGGLVDRFARTMQKDFQDRAAATVEVQYMPGAAVAVATNNVLTRANDNHTFIIADAGFVVGPAMLGTKTYREFVPAALIGESPYVIFSARATSPIRQQIANRSMINVGVANQGEVWLQDLQWPTAINIVPYKGLAPMMNDVIPGHTEYGILAHVGIAQQLADRQVHAVLVFADRRLPGLVSVPTANELGFSGAYTQNWYAIWARKDTDPRAIAEIARLTQQTTAAHFADLPGLTLLNHGPQKSADYASKEIRIFERIAEKSKK